MNEAGEVCMRDPGHRKFTAFFFVLTAIVVMTPNIVQGQGASRREVPPAVTAPTVRNAIIIGFVGGFVSRNDSKHPEVQFAAYLRDRYPTIHAEVFGNHHGRKALHQVVDLLDTDHDGSRRLLHE